MLTQFSVRNFKSIRDSITFDFQATSISEHKERLLFSSNKESYLPISVVYGPNGGGKSNVIRALFELRALIYSPIVMTTSLEDAMYMKKYREITPFLFDDSHCMKPTEFEIYFLTNIAEYCYSINLLNNEVVYESLKMKKNSTGMTSLLFERTNERTRISNSLKGIKASKEITKSLPLLSYLGIMYSNNEIISDCINWFSDRLFVVNYGSPNNEAYFENNINIDQKELFLQMLREMDIDIVDFRIEKEENSNKKRVFTTHQNNGKTYELRLDDESSGTRKVFGLTSFIISSLIKGRTLVIDELDAKLHPLLLKYLITRFTDMSINRNGAQLIFTSHDLSTMTSEFFRRDEIWFVAKGKEQNSFMYSLVEFKNEKGVSVRKDEAYNKRYLEGKYGADPYFRRIINWSE